MYPRQFKPVNEPANVLLLMDRCLLDNHQVREALRDYLILEGTTPLGSGGGVRSPQ